MDFLCSRACPNAGASNITAIGGSQTLPDAAFSAYIVVDMLDDIYNRRILALAAEIPRLERLEHPDATAVAHSKLCGSRVTVDIRMSGDVVSDFGHDVKACALGQASSSIMARNVVGSTGEELRRVREEMYAMLKDAGPAPGGKWRDLDALVPVRDFKARHASTLLTFDAVVDAVTQVEARRDGRSSG